jgi:CubicO group peptidase (beta-lactamase class C family)
MLVRYRGGTRVGAIRVGWTRVRRLALAAILLAVTGSPALAQQRVASVAALPAARVDSLFMAWDRTDSPGCAVAVYSNSEIIHARGYGMASLEHGIAITPKTVFDIGSTSKQFAAMSIVLLAEEGVLSLDDDVRRFVPELPDYGSRITIRHLLTHTSGLRDYLTLWSLAGFDDADYTTGAEALSLIVRQRALNFQPGEQYLYSNSGFFLLSVIVERASGKSLAAYAHEHIFAPLGMRHTRFNDDHTAIIANRATGYSPRADGGFAVSMSNYEQTGDGAVNTSVEDLLRWDENFYTAQVGGRRALEAMQTTAVLNDGSRLTYALGLRVEPYRGLPTVSHGGSWAGYRAELLRFPEQRFSVACLCNRSDANPSRLARRVADIYLADQLGQAVDESRPEPVEPAGTVAPTLDAATLARYAGTYDSDEIGATYTVVVEGGRLVLHRRRAEPLTLVPTRADAFTGDGLRFAFQRRGGRVTGMTVDAGRTRGLLFTRRAR